MSGFTRPALGINLPNNLFIFDGIDLSNLVVVESVERTMNPQIEVNSFAVPGSDGSIFDSRMYRNKVVRVLVRFVEKDFKTAQESKDAVARALSKIVPGKLILQDEEGYHNVALLTSESELVRTEDTLSTTLEFTCYKPFLYKNTPTRIMMEEDNGYDPDLASSIIFTYSGSAPTNIEFGADPVLEDSTVPYYFSFDVGLMDRDSFFRFETVYDESYNFNQGMVFHYNNYTFSVGGTVSNHLINIAELHDNQMYSGSYRASSNSWVPGLYLQYTEAKL